MSSDLAGRPEQAELVPEEPSTAWQWLSLLGGPITWLLHFGVVYLTAEATCASVRSGAEPFILPSTLTIVILAATALAVVASVALAAWSWWRWRHRSGHRAALALAGLLLAGGAAGAILAVGLPVLAFDPC